MQRRQRFIADQRYDLPHHDSMLAYISQEFAKYNKNFFSPANRVVKNWTIVNNGGLQVKVDQTVDSLLFNSQRANKEVSILRKTSDDPLLLNLSDNATNYVEVQISTELCAQDTVAIWDQTANGGNGEEFTQSSMTGIQEEPKLVTNTIAFTGDPDKVRLAIVTTAGGVITGITDARQMLYGVTSDWNFGSPRTDRTIGDSLDAYMALATAIKEVKGTPNWYDAPWPSASLLKEFQNLFFTDGGDIAFEGTLPANTLGWTAPIGIHIADRANSYSVPVATVSVLEGQAVYVTIPATDVAAPPLAPVVAPLSAVPINPASPGFVPGVQVLFYRINNKIYGMMDIPEITSGEVVIIGESMSNNNRNRLGLISDSAFQPYSSTINILAADNYPTAISKLDNIIGAILNDNAREEYFPVGAGGETNFVASVLTWSTSHSIPDIQVFVNGVKMKQSPDGLAANGDFIKVDDNEIEFSYLIPEGALVTIRDERTGGGGGGGGPDLNNITTNPAPVSNGAHSVGTVTKGWSGLYLKDTASAQVYRLDITAGVLNITAVP